MHVIYVAGPYRGKTRWVVSENIRRAERLAFEVAKLGAMPLCPHTNTANFDGELTDQFWLDGTLELMRRCDAVLFTDDWRDSRGAVGEHAEAISLGLPCFFSVTGLRAWLEDTPCR